MLIYYQLIGFKYRDFSEGKKTEVPLRMDFSALEFPLKLFQWMF